MRVLRPFGELKVRVGVDALFQWVAPEPVEGTPALTVQLTAGDEVLNLSAVHADLSVTGFGADRRNLTIVATTNTAGLQGKYGDAFLITDKDGVFPVRVTKIDDTSLYIADQLPRDVSVSVAEPAALQFSTWTVALTAADVTGTAQANTAYYVDYDAFYGDDAPDVDNLQETGVMHIVNKFFDTGLTHNMVVAAASQLGETLPRGQNDYSPQLQESLDEMVLWIRNEVPVGLTEDNLPAGAQFRPAHLSLLKAVLLDAIDEDLSAKFRNQAYSRLRTAMKKVTWMDINADGILDSGEEDVQVTGANANDVTYGEVSDTHESYADSWFIGRHH